MKEVNENQVLLRVLLQAPLLHLQVQVLRKNQKRVSIKSQKIRSPKEKIRNQKIKIKRKNWK